MEETRERLPNGFFKGRKKHQKFPVHFEQLINGQWIFKKSNKKLLEGFPIRISTFKNSGQNKEYHKQQLRLIDLIFNV